MENNVVFLCMVAGWCGTYVPWRWRCCWPWPWPWPWPPPPPPWWRDPLLGVIGGWAGGYLVASAFEGISAIILVGAAYLGGQLMLSAYAGFLKARR
jgi:hypothetical protein